MTEPATPTPEQLKAAFKAFKKRVKLMQLDEDSRIGGSPLSAGRRSQIMAIQPPSQFPTEIWEELVKQKKLRRAERGLYELIPEQQ